MSGRWLNIDTNAIKNVNSELTEDSSQFDFLQLSRQQRLIGFAGCFIGGFVISLLGSILLFTGNLALFAVLYSVGVVVSLVGTGFLLGFVRQFKQMFNPVRLVATCIFLAAMVMVFVSAFALRIDALAIVFCIIEYLAFLWYCLSYIPYARAAAKKLFGNLF